jgi:hypothetical protein
VPPIFGGDVVAVDRRYVYGLHVYGLRRRPGARQQFGILEDGIRICALLLGSTGCPELDKSDMRPACRLAQPHVQTAFLRLNLTYEAY